MSHLPSAAMSHSRLTGFCCISSGPVAASAFARTPPQTLLSQTCDACQCLDRLLSEICGIVGYLSACSATHLPHLQVKLVPQGTLDNRPLIQTPAHLMCARQCLGEAAASAVLNNAKSFGPI